MYKIMDMVINEKIIEENKGKQLCVTGNALRSRLPCVYWIMHLGTHIQSTLVISTSVISNNRLSRRENLVLENQVTKYCRKEEKLQFFPFSTIFSVYISN